MTVVTSSSSIEISIHPRTSPPISQPNVTKTIGAVTMVLSNREETRP